MAGGGGFMGGSVERMVVTGHIEMEQPGRRATGEQLVYTASDGMFVLTGTPAGRPKVAGRQRGTVTGTSLRFHSGDDSVVVSNGGESGAGQRVRTETRVKNRAMKTLSTEEIGKSYGGRQVVRGVSLKIEQGEVVGLLGPNGAGKTTSFYMIVGLVRPDAGRVLADGHDISRLPMYLRARNYGISYLPQEPSVFRKLTVEDNILAVLEAQQLSWESRRTRTEKLIEQLNLGHVRKTRGYALERRRTQAGGDCAVPGDRAGVYSAG